MGVRRTYEATFIVNAALEDAEIEGVVKRVVEYLENHGGKIGDINRWGRRRLAYPIRKKFNGYYVNMSFEMGSEFLPMIERFFTLEENVLRHLTIVLPKKLREFRITRQIRQAQLAAENAAKAAEGTANK